MARTPPAMMSHDHGISIGWAAAPAAPGRRRASVMYTT